MDPSDPDTKGRNLLTVVGNFPRLMIIKLIFLILFKNGIFPQFYKSAVFLPSLYKKISMVKVVHHSILDKIKRNQVNICSRLQDLGA